MLSWRTVYVPQCAQCGTAVTGPDGREVTVEQTLLPGDLRDRLAGDGWRVKAGDARRGRRDAVLGDALTCPACVAQREKAERIHHEDLHRPPVTEIDMSARLGPGWTLRQRDGDAEHQRWLVACQGEVRGMVRRYRRRTGSRGWSRGWEALIGGDGGFVRLTATAAGSLLENSSALWRSRDLAAWGIASRPRFEAPNPDWATRRRKSTPS